MSEATKAKVRIYLVETKREDGNTVQRLVRARNPAHAVAHVVVEPSARLPSQDEVIDLTRAGIEVEDAK